MRLLTSARVSRCGMAAVRSGMGNSGFELAYTVGMCKLRSNSQANTMRELRSYGSGECQPSPSTIAYYRYDMLMAAQLPELLIDGPKKASRTLALAHGAGAGMNTPFMT